MGWTIILLLALQGVMSGSANASELLVDIEAARQPLSSHLAYLPHKSGYSASQVMQLPEKKWRHDAGDIYNFGATATPYWFRTTLVNPTDQPLSRLIEFNRPFINIIDLYYYHNDQFIKSYPLGDSRSSSFPPFKRNGFLAPVTLPPNSQIQMLVYVASQGAPFQFSASLWKTHEYYAARQLHNATYIFFFGAVLSLVIYNLFVFTATRQLAYFYYSIYALSFVYAMAGMTGYTKFYLWPDSSNINEVLHLASHGVFRIGIYLFSITFLNLSHYLPRWCWVLRVLVLIEAVIVTLALVMQLFDQYSALANVVSVAIKFAVLPLPVCILTGAYLFWHGVKEARYYTIAWVTFGLGMIVYLMSLQGWVDYSPFIVRFMMFTQLLEMLLLSFALADRLNISGGINGVYWKLSRERYKVRMKI